MGDKTPSSTTSSYSSPSSSSSSSFPFSQPHHLLTFKLDNSNYLLWCAQFLPYLQGYDLEGFSDGSHPCPSYKLPDGSVNPDYLFWHKQDKLLLGWMLSFLSKSVLAKVVHYTTSEDVICQCWNIFDYAKRLADSLIASDCPVTDYEIQHALLAGLDTSYDPIVTSLTTTMHSMGFEDFVTFLLTFELRLTNQHASLSTQHVAKVDSK
ncbi:hypothetical protein BVC80_8977g9 [Macleaya cordata]|uniref:Retrotransposon Copia-like N-terminal domain-containing protein n=1 Tax=Macleaya cordata TaxID=56857 RepID=A0A200PYH6_MACCD|nr:hypothetical protein BVC80_8977g9 [Macleaya cordata]